MREEEIGGEEGYVESNEISIIISLANAGCVWRAPHQHSGKGLGCVWQDIFKIMNIMLMREYILHYNGILLYDVM